MADQLEAHPRPALEVSQNSFTRERRGTIPGPFSFCSSIEIDECTRSTEWSLWRRCCRCCCRGSRRSIVRPSRYARLGAGGRAWVGEGRVRCWVQPNPALTLTTDSLLFPRSSISIRTPPMFFNLVPQKLGSVTTDFGLGFGCGFTLAFSWF